MRRWGIIAAIGGSFLALLGLGEWARRNNAERDAGIVWTWVVSPRTSQSYLMRAKYNDDQSIASFAFDDGQAHTFVGCYPPETDAESDESVSCTDQLGLSWHLSRD
ncbi:hypothetical protein [Arenimonas sp.]|uniref:hypothetical protein n=1 Tax=Arenimonas sp. TaxID=1872635 RepID=UPI0039E4D1E8